MGFEHFPLRSPKAGDRHDCCTEFTDICGSPVTTARMIGSVHDHDLEPPIQRRGSRICELDFKVGKTVSSPFHQIENPDGNVFQRSIGVVE